MKGEEIEGKRKNEEGGREETRKGGRVREGRMKKRNM